MIRSGQVFSSILHTVYSSCIVALYLANCICLTMIGSTMMILLKSAAAASGCGRLCSAPVRRLGRHAAVKSKAAFRRAAPVKAALGGAVCYFVYWTWDVGRHPDVFSDPAPLGPWTVRFYVSLVPRKIQSRIFGYVNSLTLPIFLREPLIGLFCRVYGCDLTEALEPNLKSYSNLSEFFRRSLKPELRPISSVDLVSPADGRVDRFGEVVNNSIEQVKGITYDVSSFVGHDIASKYVPSSNQTKRYYCVIYLSPGDYHGFHSPTEWRVNFRRHFTGHLLGVSERVTHRVANLFCINERVLLAGRWKYGFFTLTAVGATNVGNISLEHENTLATNQRGRRFLHKDDLVYAGGVPKNSGDKIGEFRFGSSIVLFFEAPDDFQFKVQQGQKVKFGQSLGVVVETKTPSIYSSN